MKNKYGFWVFVMLSTLGQIHCVKTVVEPPLEAKGDAYFPLKIGKFIEYQLDSVIYDPISSTRSRIDTSYWLVRETLKDTFRDAQQQLIFRVERQMKRRNDSAATWQQTAIFAQAFVNDNAFRQENNLRFLKFPRLITEGVTWDSNILNDPNQTILIADEIIELFGKKWLSELDYIDKSEQIGTKKFDAVMSILTQTDPKILTEKRYTLEKYAKNIGLVYREVKILDTQQLDANKAWEIKAQKGYILKQTVVNFN